MKKANNTLKHAKEIEFNLNKPSQAIRNKLKKNEGSDLFRLNVNKRLASAFNELNFTLSELKKDLDLEIYYVPKKPENPKKRLGRVLKKIGKKKFDTLSEQRIQQFLDPPEQSSKPRKKSELISLALEPGTYFIRVYGKKQKSLSKYTLTLERPPLPPQITSYTELARVTENEAWVTDIEAQDLNGDSERNGGLTYAITADSADGDFFTIDENSGELRFTAPDFENPQDQDRDNLYEVEVEVKDSTSTLSRSK